MPLRVILIHVWVGCIAGAVVIAGLVMGHVGVMTFVWGGVLGLAIGIPAALLKWVYLRPDRSRQIGWTWRIAERIRRAARHRP